MPQQGVQRIEFEGQVHEFPSDFTDADIQKALRGTSATTTPAPSGNFSIPSMGLGNKQEITSQTPTGPLALSRNTPLKGFQAQAQGRVADAQQQGIRGEISPMQSGLETFTGGSYADLAGLAGQPMESIKNAALTAAQMHPLTRALTAPYFAYQGGKMALSPQQKGEDYSNYLQRALLGGSMAAGGAAGTAEGVKGGIQAGKTAATDVKNAYAAKAVAAQDAASFREGLLGIAHDNLTKVGRSAMQKLWTANNEVGKYVGSLKKDMVASDIGQSGGEASIPISDIWGDIDQLGTNFKAAGGKLPKFDAAVEAITNRKDAYGTPKEALTLDEAMNLRTELGDLWAKAARGTRDEAAVKELQAKLSDKVQNRVDEIGQSDKFKAYNDHWSILQKYKQPDSALGKLLNAPINPIRQVEGEPGAVGAVGGGGEDFFDVLRNPKYAGELARTFDSLEDFGLKKNFKKDLIEQHGDAHSFVKTKPMGKWAAVLKHPGVATAGMVAGKAAGGFLGAGVGAIKGAELADTLEGVRAIRKSGGIPSRTGEMKTLAKPEPSGESPEDAEFNARVAKAAKLRNSMNKD